MGFFSVSVFVCWSFYISNTEYFLHINISMMN